MPDSAQLKVLIAVDGSSQAIAAFKYYAEVLHKADNDVLLMHCPEFHHVSTKFAKQGHSKEDWDKCVAEEQQLCKGLQEKFEALLQQHKLTGTFNVHPTNKPGEAICTEAADKGVDMIVMGTRGLGTIRRTLTGSVSDYVVHHAHVPVVVCRH